MALFVQMHNLVIGDKYNVGTIEKPSVVKLEAIGHGDGLICVRIESGNLQLLRGDCLKYLTRKDFDEANQTKNNERIKKEVDNNSFYLKLNKIAKNQ